MYKRLVWSLSLFIILGLVAACGAAAPQTETQTEEEASSEEASSDEAAPADAESAESDEPITLRTIIGSEPPSLDPALIETVTSNFFASQMFVGLTDFDEEANLQPELATDWKVSDDGLQWTFTLREDINWVKRDAETGEFETIRPVVAGDVVYAIKRALDPNTASDYAYVLYYLDGAEAANSADPTTDNIEELLANVGVEAPDDTTVVFTLTAPAAFFPSITALSTTYPVPQEAIEEHGERWVEPGNIVTNGPYTLQEWNHGASLFIEKNPLWVNADDVQIERFGGPIIEEESTGMAMYENNEVDMLASPPGWGPPLPDMDRIKGDPALSEELFIAPRTCTYYYGFINTKPPFDDVQVRKAFSMAIDRESIVENVTKGGQQPAHSFAPPGVFGNVADNFEIGSELLGDYASRVSEAQTLLAEAGYPEGEGIEIVIGHNTSEAHAQIAQAVQAMWQEAFPQSVITIENQEWAVYIDTIEPGAPDENKPHVYRSGWCTDYPDSNNWLNEVMNSQSGQNNAKFFNDEFDALVEEAAFETNPDRRLELYSQAEEMLIDENAAIAPIYYYTSVRMYKPWVTPAISPVGDDPVAEFRIDVEAQREAIE